VADLPYPGVARRVAGVGDAVALTFDDGPHPAGTRAVLEELDRHSLRATFYVVAGHVRRHRTVVAEVVAAGHGLGLHGGPHLPHAVIPPVLLDRLLDRARIEVEDVAGVEVRSIRAPFGAASLATLHYAARAGLPLVSWSHWGRDWEPRATAASIAGRVTHDLHGGDILLLHDSDAYSARGSWERTVDAIPAIAKRLREAGLATVPVS
jgi:peptidoglycan/xylan/chitin deacetylase (PgdA/CDA1 family)